jgi:hypothetical protein
MPRSPEELEKLIHRTLRSLPDRRAPRTLEARVLAAIEQRAASAWWKQPYMAWPLAARCAFLIVSGGLVKLALMAAVWVMAGFDGAQFTEALAQPVAIYQQIRALYEGVTGFVALLFRNIPPLWLYGGLAFLGSLYAALFGLGAAAYRTLYSQR